MAERYFSATAMAGRLFIQGLGREWDSRQLVYWSEAQADQVLAPLAGDRKARTAEELHEALRASERGLPTINLWVHRDLESEARRLWEESPRA